MNRNLLLMALKVLVSASLLYFVIDRADWPGVSALLANVSLPAVAAAGLCMILAVSLNAVRWGEVLALLGSPLRPRAALVGTFEGMFFNLFLPTSVGGDALRAFRAFDRGVPASTAIASVLVDRAFGLLATGLFLLASLPLATAMADLPVSAILAVTSGAIVAGGLAAAPLGRLVVPERLPAWLRPLAALVQAYRTVLLSGRFAVAILPVQAAASLLTGGAMWLSVRAIGLDLTFFDAMVVLQASTLAALVPISFGGWGVREGASVVLLASIGAGSAEAVAVSVLFGLVLVLMGMIGALAWACSPYRRDVRFSQLRQRLAVVRRGSGGEDGR